MRRLAEPRDLACAVAHPASEEAAPMTGHTVSLNGHNAIVRVKPRCVIPSGVHDRPGEAFGHPVGDTGNDHAAKTAAHDDRMA